MKIGILGGTFNPVHYGHLRAAEEVRERLALERVLFVPAGTPPLKSDELADARHRLEMVSLAVAGNPFFEVSDVECKRPGTSYLVDTLGIISREHPDWELYFIIGSEAFAELPKWREPERLLRMARFVVLGRPPLGFEAALKGSPYIGDARALRALDRGEIESAELSIEGAGSVILLALDALPVSSTAIRSAVREGRSIRYLLPREVQLYIITEKLYLPMLREDQTTRREGKTDWR